MVGKAHSTHYTKSFTHTHTLRKRIEISFINFLKSHKCKVQHPVYISFSLKKYLPVPYGYLTMIQNVVIFNLCRNFNCKLTINYEIRKTSKECKNSVESPQSLQYAERNKSAERMIANWNSARSYSRGNVLTLTSKYKLTTKKKYQIN